MFYDFFCPCGTTTVAARITDGPVAPECPKHGLMQRDYGGTQRAINILSQTEYMEKAYRGEELPAGMTQKQVRAIMDSQVATNHRGRATKSRRNIIR